MNLVRTILLVLAAVILALLAFKVIDDVDFFRWQAGALGLVALALVFPLYDWTARGPRA